MLEKQCRPGVKDELTRFNLQTIQIAKLQQFMKILKRLNRQVTDLNVIAVLQTGPANVQLSGICNTSRGMKCDKTVFLVTYIHVGPV